MRGTKTTRGGALADYVIITALCAIGLLITATVFGNDTKRLAWTSSESIRGGANERVVYVAGHVHGQEDHTTGDMGAVPGYDTPYRWNDQAQRWYDPSTKKFVSFAEAANFVDDPYMYV